jgi:hypothetical protein
VRKKFGITKPNVSMEMFPIEKIDKEELKLIIKKIRNYFEEVFQTFDVSLESGNEKYRCEYISALFRAIFPYYFKKLIIKREFGIKGTTTWGPIDYVIFKREFALPILALVEAKKDDFEQGRAQCYMQIYSSSKVKKGELYISCIWYYH